MEQHACNGGIAGAGGALTRSMLEMKTGAACPGFFMRFYLPAVFNAFPC
jgi:hypothetical protein